MRWSEADCLSRILLAQAARQSTGSLILSVRQNQTMKIKTILSAFVLAIASVCYGTDSHTEVLLAPVEASRASQFDWGVVVKADVVREKGSTADRGSLKIDLDLAKFFQEGYAIYSITKLQSGNPDGEALMFVLIRPKK